MPGSPSLPPRPTLTRYTIAVETTAQAQVVQTLLWWLWLAALSTSARQTTLTDPDAGSYSYEYNGVGEQTKQTDSHSPVSFVTNTSYDPLGRKASRTETQRGRAERLRFQRLRRRKLTEQLSRKSAI